MQAHPDGHREVVAQRHRQRAAFGGQRVGAARVDDRDRGEHVVDAAHHRAQPLACLGVAGRGRHRLAQRAQHVLPQRRGVLHAGQAGAFIGGQRRCQTPQPARHARDAADDVVVEAAGRIAERLGCRLSRFGGQRVALRDHGTERTGHGQPRVDRRRDGGEDGLRIIGPQAPHQRRHDDLRARGELGGQPAPQQGAQCRLPSRDLRVVVDGDVQRGVQVGRRNRIGARTGQGRTDRRVERRHRHGRAVAQRREVGALRRTGLLSGDGGGPDRHGPVALRREQVEGGPGQGTVADERGAADGPDAEDPVDDVGGARGGDRAEPAVADAVQRREVGLGVGGRGDAHALGQPAQPVEPRDRGLLPGAGTCGREPSGIGSVVDDVTRGHRVDGDQQVRVHREAQRRAHLTRGVDGRAGREVHRREQRVQTPAGCQLGGEFVVDQPHRGGAAGRARREPRPVGQWPQHGQLHGVGRVRRDHGVEVVGGRCGLGRLVGRDAEDRQQKPCVVEAGRGAVVGCAVDVDQHGVHTGLLHTE